MGDKKEANVELKPILTSNVPAFWWAAYIVSAGPCHLSILLIFISTHTKIEANKHEKNGNVLTSVPLNNIVKSNVQRMKSILEYVEQKTICRKKLILSYFNEFQEKKCNKCDVCRSQKII